MATHCFIPVLGKRIRVTSLDACGNVPDAGVEGAAVVTDGFITLTLSSEVEDGAEIISKKADGSLCVNEKLPNSFKRFTVELEFCGVNPSLLAMVTNAETYEDYAEDPAGFTVGEGTIDSQFGLELWTGVSGSACVPGVDFQGGYLLLPLVVAGTLGDITVDGENAVTFSMTGAYTKGGNAWDVGPYNVLLNETSEPSPLPTALDPFDHLLLIDTAYAPPASSCDPVMIPPFITAVTPATGAAAGGTPVVITGSGFTTATSVTLGGVAATAFVLNDDSTIHATSAAHAAGAVSAVVVRPGGNITKTTAFTYV